MHDQAADQHGLLSMLKEHGWGEGDDRSAGARMFWYDHQPAWLTGQTLFLGQRFRVAVAARRL
jgi:hypothetical protein